MILIGIHTTGISRGITATIAGYRSLEKVAMTG